MSEPLNHDAIPETTTFTRFAQLAGFKPSYITQLKREGRLVLTEDGKRVKVKESLQLIESTKDPSKAGVVARHSAEREARAAEQSNVPRGPEAPEDPDEQGSGSSPHQIERQKALARKEIALATQAEHDLAVTLGKKLDREEVRTVLANAITTLRTRLESLSHVLAPQIVGIQEEARIRAVIDDNVHHTLEELARQFASIAKEQIG